jgi:quinol monooxygenase YgiN
LREEEGCLRFEVNQSRTDATVFILIEGFRDRAAFDVHAGMPHSASFIRDRDAGGWLAERTAYQLDRIFPGDERR